MKQKHLIYSYIQLYITGLLLLILCYVVFNMQLETAGRTSEDQSDPVFPTG